MKATGMVRTVDHLGRACIPKEIRKKLRIAEGDPVEVFVEGDKIILRKYNVAGDVEQMLDNLERDIHLMEHLVPVAKMKKLLDKVKDMRRILHEN